MGARLDRRTLLAAAAAVAAAGLCWPARRRAWPRRPRNHTITAVQGIKVGQHTLTERPTGCTVVIVDGVGAVGGVSQRGGAPGTRETDLLNPLNMVDKVNAISLAGGSAFGLDAASGVVRWLDEHDIGYDVRIAKVPIVPAAILFDLPVGNNPKIRPTADCGYQAAAAASADPVQEGSVGAGAGATVGKLGGGPMSAMKSGVGSASSRCRTASSSARSSRSTPSATSSIPNTGKVVAGVRKPDGTFADAREIIRSGALFERPRPGENTTIGVVATNAKLTKAEAGPHGADGRRRVRAGDLSVAHQRRRRHGVLARDRHVHRRGRHHDRRRAGGGGDGAGRRPRGDCRRRPARACRR